MPRGCRLLVIALGLVLASPSHGQEAKPDQTKPGSNGNGQLDRIASAVEKLPRATAPDDGCQPGQDNRQSDLCAQWKAADAAADSARWTFWTLFVALIGLVGGGGTLIAAWLAARWAKKAADFTETGATAATEAVAETRRIGEAQVRCYPTATTAEIGHTKGDTAMVKILVKNTGLSPAHNVTFQALVTHFINLETLIRSEHRPEGVKFEIDIPAGQEDEITSSVNLKLRTDIPKMPDQPFHVLINVIVEIRCKDVFGSDVSQTDKFSVFLKDMPIAGGGWIKLKRDSRVMADNLKIAT